ncbi:NUDIX domain-containing protein [Fibrobacter sp. UWB15]|uniref:NUDIX hydrolase n=1 Tax=unclassified Fibrobacter TaxID=2634177 RepID=UPI0009222D7E|nr:MULTISPECIES: NUDIX hydrolase [unclassified Fibrobacter]PWJ62356.1 NUDIX domain-containing protein [Fibrobacter sp. UWB6]SHG51787.1 NUDIX domain-containing protein [Fibrobacter sp. UWB8]SMG40575.1 NUDIX domain-containing protein [Fibrobacter sp. UWB15]
MKPWKLLNSEYLVDTLWLKVAKETCELPNGKVIDDFYTLWQPDWVLILARTTEGKWVMTEQYRHGTGKIELEFPAGIIDKGETPEQAAARELQEECGYGIEKQCVTLSEASKMRSRTGLDSSTPIRSAQNDTISYLGSFPVNPDRHRGKFHVVFIDGVVKGGCTHFDSTEEIESLLLSDDELQAQMADGTFNHPLQMAGYLKYKLQKRTM